VRQLLIDTGRQLVQRLMEVDEPHKITWVLRAGRGSEMFWEKWDSGNPRPQWRSYVSHNLGAAAVSFLSLSLRRAFHAEEWLER
jgi:hypothetical protein